MNKNLARILVSKAIKKGTLKKPTHCAECLLKHVSLQAHHEDYTKPLEEKWLCPLCYQRHHMAKRNNVRGPGKFKSAFTLNVRTIGAANYICLPKPFCALNNIEPGDPVAVVTAKNVLTMVFPPAIREE